MRRVAENKFKSSVACRLHPARREGPKLEQTPRTTPGFAVAAKAQAGNNNHLPLTAIGAGGFNPLRTGEMT
jgi:hypothetical protein